MIPFNSKNKIIPAIFITFCCLVALLVWVNHAYAQTADEINEHIGNWADDPAVGDYSGSFSNSPTDQGATGAPNPPAEAQAAATPDPNSLGNSCSLTHLENCVLDLVNLLLTSMGWLTNSLTITLVILATSFTQAMVKMNGNLLQNQFLTAGYSIVLSVANMLLFVTLIFIAVATILRYQQYQARSILWRVLVIAFLINFGIAIAGFFIDMGNILGMYFFQPIADKFSGNVSDMFHLAVLSSFQLPTGLAWGNLFGEALSFYLKVGFSALAALALFATGIMLLVRYIYLFILIVLLPVAWVVKFLPAIGAKAGEWWGKFLNQIFAFPIMMFFLFLSMEIMQSPIFTDALKDPSVQTGNVLTSALLPAIIAFAFIMASLVTAQSMGAAGAGAALGVASWAKGKALGFAGRKAQTAGARLASPIATGLSRIGLTRLAVGLRRPTQATLTRDLEEGGKLNEGATNGELLSISRSRTASRARKADATRRLLERDPQTVYNLPDQEQANLMGQLRTYQNVQGVRDVMGRHAALQLAGLSGAERTTAENRIRNQMTEEEARRLDVRSVARVGHLMTSQNRAAWYNSARTPDREAYTDSYTQTMNDSSNGGFDPIQFSASNFDDFLSQRAINTNNVAQYASGRIQRNVQRNPAAAQTELDRLRNAYNDIRGNLSGNAATLLDDVALHGARNLTPQQMSLLRRNRLDSVVELRRIIGDYERGLRTP